MYLLYGEGDQMIDPPHLHMVMMQIKLIYHHIHRREDFFQQQHKHVNEIYDFDMLKEV
jgi:hypothetical protein